MNFKLSIAILFFILTYTKGYSQPGNPGNPPGVPIDGGISLLAAAGIGYGTKKLIDYRKKQRKEEGEE